MIASPHTHHSYAAHIPFMFTLPGFLEQVAGILMSEAYYLETCKSPQLAVEEPAAGVLPDDVMQRLSSAMKFFVPLMKDENLMKDYK